MYNFLKDYFRMLRIKDWIRSCFWIPIIGAILIGAEHRLIILIAIISFFIFSFAFVVNNYFDAELDKTHKEKIKQNKNPLANGKINKQGCVLFLIILGLVPIIMAFFTNINGFIFVLLSLGALSLYSSKYIRLKEREGLDIISHGLAGGFLPFLAGVTLAGGSLNFPIILVGVLFIILMSTGILAHQTVDYEYDLGNTKTFAIKIGRKISCICLIVFIIASLLCFEIICRFFIIEWWLHYSILIFLVFCFPIRYIKEIKNKIRLRV